MRFVFSIRVVELVLNFFGLPVNERIAERDQKADSLIRKVTPINLGALQKVMNGLNLSENAGTLFLGADFFP